MNTETLLKYSPIALVVISIIFQWNLFVRPDQLEARHRVIIDEIARKYATKDDVQAQKDELKDMKTKIDKIYDLLINQYNISYTR